jgi:hypothetical protein
MSPPRSAATVALLAVAALLPAASVAAQSAGASSVPRSYIQIASNGTSVWASVVAGVKTTYLEHFDLATGRTLGTLSTPAQKAGDSIPLGLAITGKIVVEADAGGGKVGLQDPYVDYTFTEMNVTTGAVRRTFTCASLGLVQCGNMTVANGTVYVGTSSSTNSYRSDFSVTEISVATGKITRTIKTSSLGLHANFTQSSHDLWVFTEPVPAHLGTQQFIEINTATGAEVTHFTDPFLAGSQYFAATASTLYVPVTVAGSKITASNAGFGAPKGSVNGIAFVNAKTGKVTRVVKGLSYRFPLTTSLISSTWGILGGIVTDGTNVWVNDSGTAKMTEFRAISGSLTRVATLGNGGSLAYSPEALVIAGGQVLTVTLSGILDYSAATGALIHTLH